MIVPGTRVRMARVPIEQIVVSEHQARYVERVLHYVRLLADPQHAASHPGFIHLAPYGPEAGRYTILDGHHRFLAHVIAGRAEVLALILIEPGQPGYADSGAKSETESETESETLAELGRVGEDEAEAVVAMEVAR